MQLLFLIYYGNSVLLLLVNCNLLLSYLKAIEKISHMSVFIA